MNKCFEILNIISLKFKTLIQCPAIISYHPCDDFIFYEENHWDSNLMNTVGVKAFRTDIDEK